MKVRSLRLRFSIALVVFTALVVIPIILVGEWMNERAEEELWNAMLGAELAELDPTRSTGDHKHHGFLDSYVWEINDSLAHGSVPPAIAALPPGLHDGVETGDRELVVLIRDFGAVRAAASMDITELESEEEALSTWAVVIALTSLGLMLGMLNWLASRAVEPVTLLSAQLQARTPKTLDPFVTPFKEREITAVVDALNGFVERMHEHARRERQFIETMSHELRTPLAVILGAAEVLDLSATLEPKAAAALKRIQQTTWDLSNLAQVLLFLSGRKDRSIELETVDLRALLGRSLKLFKPEFASRGLTVSLTADDEVHAQGVRPLCEIVVNNLIRNCCDHGSGIVDIGLTSARLTISNRIVDGDGAQDSTVPRWRGNAGIGLDLIDRVCIQLGWSMKTSSEGDVFQVEIRFDRTDLSQPSVANS